LVECSHDSDQNDYEQVDEEGPGEGFDLLIFYHQIESKLVGEAANDPAERSHHHVSAGKRSRKHYYLFRVFERE